MLPQPTLDVPTLPLRFLMKIVSLVGTLLTMSSRSTPDWLGDLHCDLLEGHVR